MQSKETLQAFTILLVDDRPENLISLEELLIQPGRRFIKAQSGNEALRQVLKHENIGLIMLDVQMPDMDGFEVARILKSNAKTKDISIIFVTALSREEHFILKGFEEGAVDYLPKPLDINVVRAKVNVFEQLYLHQVELKSTLSELKRINKQLEQFVYIVSHDLKSPLSSMMLLMELIREDELVIANPELKENIDLLHGASGRLSNMIASLLEHSRTSLANHAIEKVNTSELVREVVALLFPPDQMTINIREPLPVINTHKIGLQQVFQNLLSNAIKYNDKEKGLIEIGASDKGHWVEFYVKDNGPGIADNDQERIFKLFETTSHHSSSDSSTGIGLNLLKVLVEGQGGKIWVDSVKDEGSTFYFEWEKNH